MKASIKSTSPQTHLTDTPLEYNNKNWKFVSLYETPATASAKNTIIRIERLLYHTMPGPSSGDYEYNNKNWKLIASTIMCTSLINISNTIIRIESTRRTLAHRDRRAASGNTIIRIERYQYLTWHFCFRYLRNTIIRIESKTISRGKGTTIMYLEYNNKNWKLLEIRAKPCCSLNDEYNNKNWKLLSQRLCSCGL